MDKQLVCLDSNYSTTRLCYKLLGNQYLNKHGKIKEESKFHINIPKVKIRNSKLIGKFKDKFETYLFLPIYKGRKGEGGLRTKGYLKYSYEIESDRWYACNFYGQRLFEIDLSPEFDVTLHELNINNNIISLPLVTVITVVFNGEKYLEDTIQSVIKQTYPNIEYIIIDGGSTDGTIDIIKKYENYIDYWISESDKGISEAFNKGLYTASGKFLAYLNADDYWNDKEFITRAISDLEQNRQIDIIFGDLTRIDPHTGSSFFLKGDKKFYKKIKYTMPHLSPPSIICKLKCYEMYGIHDETLNYAMDYEILLRFYINGCNFKYNKKLKAIRRLGGISNRVNFKRLVEVRNITLKYGLNPLIANIIFIVKLILVNFKK